MSTVYIISSQCKSGGALSIESRPDKVYKIKCKPFQNRPNQKWHFESNMFTSLANGLALTYLVDKKKLTITTPTGELTQLWDVKGSSITSKVDGKAIDYIQGLFGASKGTTVQMYSKHGRLNQRWSVIKLEDYVMGKEKIYSRPPQAGTGRKWLGKAFSPSLRRLTNHVSGADGFDIFSQKIPGNNNNGGEYDEEDIYFDEIEEEEEEEDNNSEQQNGEHEPEQDVPKQKMNEDEKADVTSFPEQHIPESILRKKKKKKKKKTSSEIIFLLESKSQRNVILRSSSHNSQHVQLIPKAKLTHFDSHCSWTWNRGKLINLKHRSPLEYHPQLNKVTLEKEKSNSEFQNFKFDGFCFVSRFDGKVLGFDKNRNNELVMLEDKDMSTQWILSPIL